MLSGLHGAPERFMGARFADVFAARPFIVYDIGAAGGVYPLLDRKLFAHQRTHGFEPEPGEYAKLAAMYRADGPCQVHELAIAERTGSIAFYVDEDATGSSTISVFERMTPIEVRASRLDDLAVSPGLPPADFIKLDIEGGELAALESGPAMLEGHVVGVVSEIGFWRYAEGQTRFAELDAFLTDRGFILFDLTLNRSNWSNVGGKKGKVRSGDALYLRNFQQFHDTALAGAGRDEARAHLFKLLLVCYRYLYVDYALEVAEFGRAAGLLDRDEFAALARELATVTDVSRRLPRFPGRGLLSRLLDLASYAVNEALKKDKPVVYSRLGNTPRLARRQALPAEALINCPAFVRRETFKTIKLDR